MDKTNKETNKQDNVEEPEPLEILNLNKDGQLEFEICGEWGFLVKVTDVFGNTVVDFEVYEINARNMDGSLEDFEIGTDKCSIELYLKCAIRWDECSHFWFGDEEGYLHICGEEAFKKHNELMDFLHTKALEIMEREHYG